MELKAWLAWLEAFQTVSNGEPPVESEGGDS